MDEIRNQENIRQRGEFEKYNEFNKGMVEVICPYCSKDFKIKKLIYFRKENDMGALLKEIKEYIGIARWKYVKTMPKHPHEHTVKDWDLEKVDMFNKFVIFIREEGYDEYFYRKKMRYYNIEGYKYWTMGAPLEKTILINRAKI